MKTATTIPSVDSWASDVAADVLARDASLRHAREDRLSDVANLRAVVDRDGRVWFQRVEADLRAAAAAFNARIGRPLVTVFLSPNGRIVASAQSLNGAGYLAVLPLLSTAEAAVAPGALVQEQRFGRATDTPYDFGLDGDALRLRAAGEWLSPEAFARTTLGPWLASIALGGR